MKNKLTSWDNYSDLSEEEFDVEKSEIISQATRKLFLRKYAVSQLEEEVLLKIFRDCKYNDNDIKTRVDRLTHGNSQINNTIFQKPIDKKDHQHTKKKFNNNNSTKDPQFGKTYTQSCNYNYNTGKKHYPKNDNWNLPNSKKFTKGNYKEKPFKMSKEGNKKKNECPFDENDIDYYFQAALKLDHNCGRSYDCNKSKQSSHIVDLDIDRDTSPMKKSSQNEERNEIPLTNNINRETSNSDTIDESKSKIGESIEGSVESRSLSEEPKVANDEVKKRDEIAEKVIQ